MPVSKIEYDLKKDLGLVANNSSDSVCARNTALLNDAMENIRLPGEFTFTDYGTRPVLLPLRATPEEYYFEAPIQTSELIGTSLLGYGCRSYPLPTASFTYGGITQSGGAQTRFTAINGDDGVGLLRLRGHGALISGIEFRGIPYSSDGTGEGPATGNRAVAGIEVEGRSSIATGGHTIHNCGFTGFQYGIVAKAGYYSGGTLQANENHADNCVVNGVNFWSCQSCFRSENIQAVNWFFRDMRVGGFGGSGLQPVTVFDIQRGGDVYADGIDITNVNSTLFNTSYYSHNTQRLVANNVKWDYMPGETYYITLFKYSGSTGDASYKKWSVRITGHIADSETDPSYDATKLIQIKSGATSFPLSDVLVDVSRLPTTGFSQLGGWWYPQTASDWLY